MHIGYVSVVVNVITHVCATTHRKLIANKTHVLQHKSQYYFNSFYKSLHQYLPMKPFHYNYV